MVKRLQLFVVLAFFVAAAISLAAARQSDVAPEKERAALLAFLKTRGIELRPAEHRSNAISHMYSIGPEHEQRLLVGLTYFEREPTYANVLEKHAIAIPFVINRHWVLWQVGGPGGNATKAYLVAWDKVLPAFRAYP
jgi:hypothetical protein